MTVGAHRAMMREMMAGGGGGGGMPMPMVGVEVVAAAAAAVAPRARCGGGGGRDELAAAMRASDRAAAAEDGALGGAQGV